jgi:hypothetical protein
MNRQNFLTTARRSALWTSLTGLSVAAGCLLSVPAQADPFNNGDLFVGRTIKHSSSDRLFTAGARFQIAPVEAIVQSAVQTAIDDQVKKNPEAAVVIGLLEQVDTAELKKVINDVDKFKALLKEQAAANGQTLTPEQATAIDQVDTTKLATIEKALDIIDIYKQPKKTLTFSLEPFVTLNLAPVAVTATVPLAGFQADGLDASFEMGNVGLDLQAGDSYGLSGAAFGWTVGLSSWLPTATLDAGTISLSNVLASPRYLHDYMTFSPYAVIGGDLAIFDVTLRAEYVQMLYQGDRDKPDISYLNYGGGLLADFGFVGLSLELDGLMNISNAAAMDNVFLATAGLRSYLGPVQVGAGVQLPLVQDANTSGASLGKPADFNVLVNAQVKF